MAFHSLRNHNPILMLLLGFILITILLTAIINFNATNLQTHASGAAAAAPSAPPGVFRLTTVPGSSDPNQDEWSMFRGQLNHTGEAHTPPISHTGPFWNYTTGCAVRSSPAVAGGRVYVGSDDYKVYCLNATTGKPLWNYTTGGAVYSSPAVAGGRVYVGSDDRKVYCLNATTGGRLWNYTTGGAVWPSPAVAGGRVYVGSGIWDGKVYCLNATTGGLLWSYSTGYAVRSSPAVAGGRVYVGSNDTKIHCLNAITGEPLWSYTTGYAVRSSPAVAGGRVYVGSSIYDRKVYCLNATTGGLLWNYTTGYAVYSSPAVAGGRVYVGSWDRKVYCLNATTGGLLWNYTTGGQVGSSPAVAGGRVYMGSDDKVYCLDATAGTSLWNYNTGGQGDSSPAVTSGRVYVGSNDGKIYCLPCIFGNQTLPNAPQNLQITAGNGQITLTWQAPSSNGGSPIINYNIYRGTLPDSETYLMTVGNVLTSMDINLTNGITYYYKVSAVNGVGEGPLANEVNATAATGPITLTSVLPNPSKGLTTITATNASKNVNANGIWANVSTPSGGWLYPVMTYVESNQWIGTFTVASDGDYTVRINATETSGGTTYAGPMSITGDITPPSLAIITSPTVNASVRGTIWINATAADVVSGIKNITFYRDAALLIGMDTTAPFAVQWATSGDGVHILYARAFDYAGNYLDSVSVTITVNNTPPRQQAPIWIRIGDNGNGDLTLQWIDNPLNTLEFIIGYNIYRMNSSRTNPIKCAYITPQIVKTHVDYGVPNGTWTFYITTMDKFGGESGFSTPYNLTIYDTTAPGAPTGLKFDTPDNGDSNFTISWVRPTNIQYGSDVVRYEIYILIRPFTTIAGLFPNATVTGFGWFPNGTIDYPATYYNFSWLADNNYYIRIRAIDENNFASSLSTMINRTVDTTPPTLWNLVHGPRDFIYTTYGAYTAGMEVVLAGTSVEVTAFIFDLGGIDHVQLNYQIGISTIPVNMVLDYIFANQTRIYKTTITGFTSGTLVRFNITVYDKYSHYITSISFQYLHVGLYPVKLTGIQDNGNGDLNLTWTDDSRNPDYFIYSYNIYRINSSNGYTVLVQNIPYVIKGTHFYIDYGRPNGNWAYFIITLDRAFRTNPPSRSLYRVVIDTIAPGAPWALRNATLEGLKDVTIIWNAPRYENAGADVVRYNLYISMAPISDVTGLLPNATLFGRSNTSYSLYNLSDNTYYFIVIAYDENNYRSSFSNMLSLTVDRTKPEIVPGSIRFTPQVPAGVQAEVTIMVYDRNGISSIKINWTANNWINSSRIEMVPLVTFPNGTAIYRASISGQAAGTHIQFSFSVEDNYRNLRISSECRYDVIGAAPSNYTFYLIIFILFGAVMLGASGYIIHFSSKIKRFERKITGLPNASIGKTTSKSWKLRSPKSFGGEDQIKHRPLSDEWNNALITLEKEFAVALLNGIRIDEPNILEEP